MKALALALLLPFLQAAPLLTETEEARAPDLMREIRCVACENEPISQSAADISEIMRTRVRVMVAEGATDAEVREWFAGRYGEFVLFRPDTSGPTGWVLWGAPFALLLAAIGFVVAIARRRGAEDRVSTIAPEDLQD